jgi:AcrR family transcriptional regulator
MDAGPRYLEGTTVGSGRDIIGVRRDRIAAIIEQGRELIARAKAERILPETITGATAALLVTIGGYGEPLSEGQWRELSGVVGGIMRDPAYADLARLRTLITHDQFQMVTRNQGYLGFIKRLDDGRWVCVLTPRLEDVPDN